MKKAVFIMGLSTVLISPAVLADYSIYGKANLGLEHTETDNSAGAETSTSNLKSYASRIGIKGTQKLTDNLDAVYKWETEVDLTGEDAGTGLLKARNQFIGLKGSFGTVIGGIHDTPMKQAEGKIDLFSDIVDIARVQDKYMDTQEREKDFLGYYSPKTNHLQFQLATMPGKSDDQEIFGAYSTALVYGDKKLKKTKFFAALAYDKGVDASEESKAVRLSGSTQLSAMIVGAIYERADSGAANTDKQDRYVLSGKYTLPNNNTLLLQYAGSKDVDGIKGSTDTTIGLSHKIAKSTRVYGLITKGKNVKGVDGDDETRAIVGIVHKFKF